MRVIWLMRYRAFLAIGAGAAGAGPEGFNDNSHGPAAAGARNDGLSEFVGLQLIAGWASRCRRRGDGRRQGAGSPGSLDLRWPLARKPSWRMRWKPSGSTCCKNRRMNSWASRRMDFLRATMSVIAPAEGDMGVAERDKAAVRDGNTVGVARQKGEYLFRPCKRLFRVYHPVRPALAERDGRQTPPDQQVSQGR